jgi:glycosyltransferase involved in cell wall biosynthesis
LRADQTGSLKRTVPVSEPCAEQDSSAEIPATLMPLRTLFITSGGPSHPSSRVRVFQFLASVRREVGPASVVTMDGGKWRVRLKQAVALLKAIRADAVVIQYLGSAKLARSMMKVNRRVIYDIDDAVYLGSPEMIPVLPEFEQVVVGNNTLADYVRKLNPRVTMIPSVVDEARFPIGDAPPVETGRLLTIGRPVTIGWIGHADGFVYFEQLAPVFKALRDRFDDRAVFKVVSSKPFDFGPGGPPVQNKTWKLEDEAADVQSFDIGIMPLIDNEWNRNKCAYKALLYMSQAKPAVVSPIGANAEVIADGVDGYHATTAEEWIEKLSRLIEDRDLRHRLGLAARETIRQKYTVAAVMPALGRVLRGDRGDT